MKLQSLKNLKKINEFSTKTRFIDIVKRLTKTISPQSDKKIVKIIKDVILGFKPGLFLSAILWQIVVSEEFYQIF